MAFLVTDLETFSQVAKLNLIRMILSLATYFSWQLDVKNVFMVIFQEVYINPPPRFVVKEHERKVLRLRKALYGPKQSPHAWFDGICQAILQYGYDRCHVDHIVFIKLRVIKSSCCKKKLRVEFLSNLKSRIGEFKYFLGMKVKGAVIALCNCTLD